MKVVVRVILNNFLIFAFVPLVFQSCGNSSNGKYPIIDPIRSQVQITADSLKPPEVAGQPTAVTNTVKVPPPVIKPTKSIFETISLSVDHTLFIAAIEASGYEEMLSGKKDYTVFAPDDNAFKALPRATLNNLLKPSFKDQLKKLISNHIINKRLTMADIKDGTEVKTIGGKTLTISNKAGKITIVNGVLISTDAACTNGYLNIINQVIQ